jgi:hypothetical protein
VEWKQAGEEQDVVEIRLPGFRKEHVAGAPPPLPA